LEELLARPDKRLPRLHAALDDRDPIVATNAAIALARRGDASAREQLARAVGTPDMKLPIRLAAAEALGGLADRSSVAIVRELIDQYGRREQADDAGPVPKLHAELIRSLAKTVDPADDPRFVEALRSRAAEVRLEAVQAWSAGQRGPLPVEAADLRADPDPRVRAAALSCLARRRHPQAQQYLAAALDDCDLAVRIAAIEALGSLGGAEAQATLQRLRDDRAELIRAAAVSALAASGAQKPVFDAAADESWRVRLEVARALVGYPNRSGAGLAHELIDDPSASVRRQTVASVAEWPLDQAGPVLLAAMGKTGYMTRKNAAGQLAALWPPGAEFPVDGPAQRRAEMLGELERRFRGEVGFVDPEVLAAAAIALVPTVSPETVAEVEQCLRDLADPVAAESLRRRSRAALVALGPELVEALERLALDRHEMLPEIVYREVLPDCDSAFAVLDRLASDDVSIRRRAAEELADLTRKRPLGCLATWRLFTLAVTETDQLVWQNVLAAVATDPSEPAVRLASAAISHPSPEVRRRACEHLGAHSGPTRRHVDVLLPALEDEDPLVVRAAARALGNSGGIDDTGPLERLLLSDHESVRVEAAGALCRLGDPSGPAALERLSYSNDKGVRRQVAASMGEIADATFVASLVRLLDDRQSTRLAALEALPRVVGHDVAAAANPAPTSSTERVALWKRWYQRRGSAAGMRPLTRDDPY